MAVKKNQSKNFFKDPEWILRLGIFGTFLGHGVFALGAKAGWLPYFASVGIGESTANILMPMIGSLDLLVALKYLQ